jgi:nicotinamidase-related amidase
LRRTLRNAPLSRNSGIIKMTSALLLLDLQIDFLSDNGRMPVGSANAERVILAANRMIKIYEDRRWPIIVIYNQFKKTDKIANFFRKFAAIEGSEGGNMDPRIHVHDGIFISKTKSSAFTNPDLSEHLKNMCIDNVVLCGVYAEGCVRATALDAQRANLRTTLISDGVASNRKFKYQWALSHMQKKGIKIMSYENYIESDSNMPLEPSR